MKDVDADDPNGHGGDTRVVEKINDELVGTHELQPKTTKILSGVVAR